MNFLDGLMCYRDAVELLLKNIKAYAILVVLNLVFFGLLLLAPAGVFVSIYNPGAEQQSMLIAAMVAAFVFTAVNYPMLAIAHRTAELGDRNAEFSVKDLFKIGIKWRIVAATGVCVNFIAVTLWVMLAAVMSQAAGPEIMMAAFSIAAIISIVGSLFSFIYVGKCLDSGDFRTSWKAAKRVFSKHAKPVFGFIAAYLAACLLLIYLGYDFINSLDKVMGVFFRQDTFIDMQQSMMHALMSAAFIVLFNTINLAAKGMLCLRLKQEDSAPKKYLEEELFDEY